MAEEESKGLKFSDILKVVGGLLVGGALGAGVRSAGVLRGAKASDLLKGAALTYPGLTENFVYPIKYEPDFKTHGLNRLLDRDLIFRYPLAQTLEEHNRAVANGTEKLLESWFPGEDTKPRKDFHPSSSAVSDIRIMPDNTIQIRWGGKGKFYTYRGGSNPRESSEIAKELLTAPSIGRALPRKGLYAHNGKDDRKGHPDPNIGWWGRRYAL